ncbi:conserved domain protein [delta proteobacterium NaphS2]|nr:conserved domain protein [delta proteobacterium NaphS2]
MRISHKIHGAFLTFQFPDYGFICSGFGSGLRSTQQSLLEAREQFESLLKDFDEFVLKVGGSPLTSISMDLDT